MQYLLDDDKLLPAGAFLSGDGNRRRAQEVGVGRLRSLCPPLAQVIAMCCEEDPAKRPSSTDALPLLEAIHVSEEVVP